MLLGPMEHVRHASSNPWNTALVVVSAFELLWQHAIIGLRRTLDPSHIILTRSSLPLCFHIVRPKHGRRMSGRHTQHLPCATLCPSQLGQSFPAYNSPHEALGLRFCINIAFVTKSASVPQAKNPRSMATRGNDDLLSKCLREFSVLHGLRFATRFRFHVPLCFSASENCTTASRNGSHTHLSGSTTLQSYVCFSTAPRSSLLISHPEPIHRRRSTASSVLCLLADHRQPPLPSRFSRRIHAPLSESRLVMDSELSGTSPGGSI